MKATHRVGYAPEDARHAVSVLRTRPGDRVLVAAAGCDDAIAHALAGAEVTLAHPDPIERARVVLLRAGLESAPDALPVLMGVEDGDRSAALERAMSAMPSEAKASWHEHASAARVGLWGASALDASLRAFGQALRRDQPALVSAIQGAATLEDQRRAFATLRTPAWRLRFILAITRRWHKWWPRSGRATLATFERVMHHHLARENPFVSWWFEGSSPSRTPWWLADRAALAQALARVTVAPADALTVASDAPPGSWTVLHVSGGWGGVPDGPRLLATFARVGAPRARILWWAATDEEPTWPVALVDKIVPGRILPQHEAADRSWMHGGIRLAERP